METFDIRILRLERQKRSLCLMDGPLKGYDPSVEAGYGGFFSLSIGALGQSDLGSSTLSCGLVAGVKARASTLTRFVSSDGVACSLRVRAARSVCHWSLGWVWLLVYDGNKRKKKTTNVVFRTLQAQQTHYVL